MAYAPVITVADTHDVVVPHVRTITFADIKDALARGVDDFAVMPSHAVFLCLIYPIIGLVLGTLTFGYQALPLLFPLASGFVLLGPVAAIGLYELSRRREQGLDAAWSHAFDVLQSPSRGAIAMLGLMLVLVFGGWLVAAQTIYWFTFGTAMQTSVVSFLHEVVTTPAGWTLIVAGMAVGFVFAVVTFMISVVAFPLLLDRPVGAADAVITSVRAVIANPLMMATWGFIVAAALVLGSIPAFIGLAVVVPILGHATWHLYRKVIYPDATPVQERLLRPRGRRYAAEFPASLFAPSGDDERSSARGG
jgi:uncharacterized membrane protein